MLWTRHGGRQDRANALAYAVARGLSRCAKDARSLEFVASRSRIHVEIIDPVTTVAVAAAMLATMTETDRCAGASRTNAVWNTPGRRVHQ